jgi:hypothetical protein
MGTYSPNPENRFKYRVPQMVDFNGKISKARQTMPIPEL